MRSECSITENNGQRVTPGTWLDSAETCDCDHWHGGVVAYSPSTSRLMGHEFSSKIRDEPEIVESEITLLRRRVRQLELENSILESQLSRNLPQPEPWSLDARFRHLVDRLGGIAIQGYDQNRRVIYWNQGSTMLYGYEESEALGKQLEDLIIPPEMRPTVIQLVHDWLTEGVPIPNGELKLLRKDGSLVDVFSCHSLLRDEFGAPVLFCTDIDLTERKRAEEAQQQSERKFRRLFEQTAAPLLLLDAEAGVFIDCNQAALDALRCPDRSNVVSCSPKELSPEFQPDGQTSEAKANEIFAIVQKEGWHRFEWIHCSPYRTNFPVEVLLTSIQIDERPLFITTWRDITDRKLIENTLRESEQRFRSLADNSPLPIALANLEDTRILYMNQRMCDLFETTFVDAIGTFVKDYYVDEAECLRTMKLAEDQSSVFGNEVKMKTARGRELWISQNTNIILVDGKRVAQSVMADITQRKLVEAHLVNARDAAEAANRAKSNFLANMSHELRTPMNGVLGFASLLESTPLNDEQKQFVSTIVGSGQALLDIINSILDYASFEDRQMVLVREVFDLHHLLSEVIEVNAPQMNAKGLGFSLTIAPEVPARIRGDAAKIRQILQHFIGNAYKFTYEGSVRVACTLVSVVDSTCSLLFEVMDTGIGISDSSQMTIFEPFVQADSSVTRRYGGTGLGLAICNQLVSLMNGTIGVDSKVNEGSTFWFMAVFEKSSDDSASTKTSAPPKVEEPKKSTSSSAKQRRILVVEDIITNQKVALALLKRLGYEADVANNGVEAITAVQQEHYDLILMDCQMPELDGYEATLRIRQPTTKALNPKIPIVALTANVVQGDREKCLLSGMNDYLPKPVSKNSLAEMLQKWLREKHNLQVTVE